jgi:hypothetical protein
MAFNLEEVDVDGAIRNGADDASGDTRLSFLKKGALAGGAALSGGAVLSALVPGAAMAASTAPPATPFGKGDIGILNFALTLEYLERAFYEEATSKGLVKSGQAKTFLKTTLKDEKAHVAFLVKALGKSAIKEPSFNFGKALASESVFLDTAYVLENTGVHAYLGQAGNIKTPAYLLAAASIVTIEARHAGAVGLIIGKGIDQVGSFDTGLPAAAILKAVTATKFITKL